MQKNPFGGTGVRLCRQAVITLLIFGMTKAAGADHPEGNLRRLPPLPESRACSEFDSSIARILRVSFSEPLTSSGNWPGGADRFQLLGVNQPSPTRLANDFTGDPDFASGLLVIVDDVALKIGGYVKADLIKDFDAIDTTDSFDTSAIPTSGPERENARFHARQSRLSFDTRWLVDGDIARAFIEADFFGSAASGGDSFRLRHAYGHLGRFTAGQTWTTFTDPSAVPQTLDVDGGVSNVNRRQGLVRWTQPFLFDGLSVALAVEDPRVTVEAPPALPGEGRSQTPDFVTRLRLQQDWGEFQGAFVLRELGFQPLGEPVLTETAWGFNFTGSFLLTSVTKPYYQITFGDGIGSYRGAPDVIPTGPDTAAILSSFGWMIGLKQEWTQRLTSNFTFSQLSMGRAPGQDPDNLSDTTYLAVNLIANPYERVFCGIEYLYGIREDVSGARGEANRLQMAFGFYLP